MYYNSNSDDYYNAYKKELAELEAYRKEESVYRLLKFLLFFLTLVLFSVAAFYLYEYFNPTLNHGQASLSQEQARPYNEKLSRVIIREEDLPQSIQLRESPMQSRKNIPLNATDTRQQANVQPTLTINEKDIQLIVQTIMTQMNIKKEPPEIPLEEQLEAIAHKHFKKKTLQQQNHYNKVVLSENSLPQGEKSSLMKLSNNLNTIINENSNPTSTYAEAIKKEVTSRENEMRIIIVQKGDTLSKIAQKAYGNRNAYEKIFAANPEIIKNPNEIFVGQRLRIPS